MLEALYQFFYSLFGVAFENANGDMPMLDYSVALNLGGASPTYLPLGDYFSFICSLISLIFIVVLCCLFVYKIIKLVGNLIR